MIRLSEQSPLGTGRHRKCYAHPEDAQRCIKIVYHRGDGGDKEIRRELKYYAHLGRRLKDWSGIPRYHGTVETDCGTGYVYDVIADFDGKQALHYADRICCTMPLRRRHCTTAPATETAEALFAG